MTTSAEIRTQIQQIENQKRAAAEAEASRIANEQTHQRELEAAEATLATLQRAELEVTIQELKAAHAAKMQAWEQSLKVLWARLESPDLKLSDITPQLLSGVDNAYHAAQDSAARISSAVGALQYGNAYETQLAELMTNGTPRYLAERQLAPAVAAAGLHIQGLTVAVNPPNSLALWISLAHGDFERRKRQAVAFLLTGFQLDPSADFQPRRDFLSPRIDMG